MRDALIHHYFGVDLNVAYGEPYRFSGKEEDMEVGLQH
jgi:hypothetical protein